ncbi:MAG TPA: protein-L-isoaspartate O-methyltransferase [Caulobacteraceae bacterium]|nr:protein-L-isoaspartate O-methyltransferase [Caulobacteraceae bacterium]
MDIGQARANMVDTQVRTNDVTDLDLVEAIRVVPRERFCAPARAFAAYADAEPEICPGRWLMRPRDVAKLLQAARPVRGEKALAIAAPYAAAVLAKVGLEVTAQEGDARAVAVVGPALEEAGVVSVTADLATPQGADWDLIVCEGAVGLAPQAWVAALRPGGRLAVVVRDGPVGKARLFVRLENGGESSREVFDATPPVLQGFERQSVFTF